MYKGYRWISKTSVMRRMNESPVEDRTEIHKIGIHTHLKLAVSTQAQPNLTTHLGASSSAVPTEGAGREEHGVVLSGRRKPLSRANCSRQMGRKRVRETMTKTSLANA